MELRLPHGAGLKPDRIPKDIPTAMGTAGADTDTCDLEQTRRLEAKGGPYRNGPGSTCRSRRHRDRTGCHRTPGRDRGSRGPTGFRLTCRPLRIRGQIDNHRVPGHSRCPTTHSRGSRGPSGFRPTGQPQHIWGRTDNHRIPGRRFPPKLSPRARAYDSF